MLNKLLNYNDIYQKWLNSNGDQKSAIELTLQQLDTLEDIVINDESWFELIKIARKGRHLDAWLALDLPYGFDELIICLPLCKFSDWGCSKCTVGSRQENYSCSNNYSLFGYIGDLVINGLKKDLLIHINNIRLLLNNRLYEWNVHSSQLIINYKM